MKRLLPIAAVVLAGCGGSPGDLLAVDSSGGAAGRQERLVIRSDGQATCNGSPAKDIGSDALIEARAIERELADLAERAASYQADAPGATGYVARTKGGTVRWDEAARGLPPVLPRTQLFALQQGRRLC